MNTQERIPSPPADDTVKRLALRLAPPLIRKGLNVTVGRNGVIEIRNPCSSRMRQLVALGDRDGELAWFWLWSGPTRDAPPEYEPMVSADAIDEAVRRIVNVLSIADA